ncbi:hypothetical protein J2T57_003701 [Natronocella acetinitrilica]|uniref:Uncharacterized protein n=1 Tax=Natronocella acetinitrilica TaxID=414046 RepID=A0AAE3G614_9GAMM|nr:hypothetical protein [Natronocella acetinitrilica]MCP1676540.1 hypothetical protein [Natronocella acetinitrilica]
MELTETEEQQLRTVLEGWFGASVVDNWTMNIRLLDVLAEALSRLSVCSEMMDRVPRPMGTPDRGYIRRQLAGMARRARNQDAAYLICRDALRYGYRGAFELAGQGL